SCSSAVSMYSSRHGAHSCFTPESLEGVVRKGPSGVMDEPSLDFIAERRAARALLYARSAAAGRRHDHTPSSGERGRVRHVSRALWRILTTYAYELQAKSSV